MYLGYESLIRYIICKYLGDGMMFLLFLLICIIIKRTLMRAHGAMSTYEMLNLSVQYCLLYIASYGTTPKLSSLKQ